MKLTTLCYLEQGSRYLMLHRTARKDDENYGKWIGIGGKFEEGESPEECLLAGMPGGNGAASHRLPLPGHRHLCLGPLGDGVYAPFTASRWEGEETPCGEGELRWIEKARLRELTLWEGDRIFLRLLEEGAPFFSLKLRYRGDLLEYAALDGAPLPL